MHFQMIFIKSKYRFSDLFGVQKIKCTVTLNHLNMGTKRITEIVERHILNIFPASGFKGMQNLAVRKCCVMMGMLSLGIVEGSSVMGLSEAEYAALSPEEKEAGRRSVEEKFLAAGASAVLRNLSELPAYLEGLE